MHRKKSSILYVSSEKFTNQFIDALRNNKVQDFSAFYLNLDTLILDDVQFMSGKEKTQEYLFPHIQSIASEWQANHNDERLPAEGS